MNFQDFLINTTTARSGLKPSFNTGETPTQQNFHDLIDGLFLLQDDSIYKDANNGLAIRTGANNQALLFFDHDSQDLTWSVEIDNGLHIKDKDSNARLSVLSDGKVGVGTTSPGAKLHITDFTDNNSNAGLIIGSPDTSSVGFNSGIYDHSIGNPSLVVYPTSNSAYALYAGEATGSDLFWVRGDGVGFFKGNVGIGTASPNQKLDVKGKLRISDEGTTESVDVYYQNADVNETSYPNTYPQQHERAVFLKANAYQDQWGAGGSGFQFWTYGITGGSYPNYEKGHIQAMVIRKNGSVGIGTANPSYTLDVNGTLNHSGAISNVSDLRFKKDVQALENITKLSQLRGVSYQWRKEEFKERNFSEGKQLGFIAQEMQEAFPELVSEDKEGYLSVNYTGLIPVLTEAVKDLNNKNEALEARVLHLEQLLLNANTLN